MKKKNEKKAFLEQLVGAVVLATVTSEICLYFYNKHFIDCREWRLIIYKMTIIAKIQICWELFY